MAHNQKLTTAIHKMQRTNCKAESADRKHAWSKCVSIGESETAAFLCKPGKCTLDGYAENSLQALREATGFDEFTSTWAKVFLKTTLSSFWKPWAAKKGVPEILAMSAVKWGADTIRLSYNSPVKVHSQGANVTVQGNFDSSTPCSMATNVKLHACPNPWTSPYSEYKKCTAGYVQMSVATSLSGGAADQKCHTWFVYADTALRSSVAMVRTNWLTDRAAEAAMQTTVVNWCAWAGKYKLQYDNGYSNEIVISVDGKVTASSSSSSVRQLRATNNYLCPPRPSNAVAPGCVQVQLYEDKKVDLLYL